MLETPAAAAATGSDSGSETLSVVLQTRIIDELRANPEEPYEEARRRVLEAAEPGVPITLKQESAEWDANGAGRSMLVRDREHGAEPAGRGSISLRPVLAVATCGCDVLRTQRALPRSRSVDGRWWSCGRRIVHWAAEPLRWPLRAAASVGRGHNEQDLQMCYIQKTVHCIGGFHAGPASSSSNPLIWRLLSHLVR